MKLRSVVLVTCSVFLFNCSINPHDAATNTTNQLETTDEESLEVVQTPPPKAKDLSAYKRTTIQTSNGEITIEPTVVSTTDQMQADENASLEVLNTEYSDPLQFINRPIFAFNHFTYKYLFIPLAKGYNYALPKPVRNSVSNVFSNIREPLNLVNNALTGDIGEAGNNLGRFLINSTVGLLGLFDPADSWFGIEAKPKTFTQTLMNYDVGSGVYLVLPFLGQSDVRNTASIITEGFVHPLNYALKSPDNTVARAIDGFDDFSNQMDIYVKLFDEAEDPYLYFRNQYIQSTNRDEIALDNPPTEVNVSGTGSNE